MRLYRFELAEFFGTLDVEDQRPFVLSSEDLCGCMPGRCGLVDYRAAPYGDPRRSRAFDTPKY